MFRSITLFQLVRRLIAVEDAANNPILQRFTINDHAEEVLVEGWKLIGSLYYNLVRDQVASTYPETNQVILSRTGDKDDFELKPEAVLVDDYLAFQHYLVPMENLVNDCWMLLSLGFEAEDAGDPDDPDREPPFPVRICGDKTTSEWLHLTLKSDAVPDQGFRAVLHRGGKVNCIDHRGQIEEIASIDVELDMVPQFGPDQYHISRIDYTASGPEAVLNKDLLDIPRPRVTGDKDTSNFVAIRLDTAGPDPFEVPSMHAKRGDLLDRIDYHGDNVKIDAFDIVIGTRLVVHGRVSEVVGLHYEYQEPLKATAYVEPRSMLD